MSTDDESFIFIDVYAKKRKNAEKEEIKCETKRKKNEYSGQQKTTTTMKKNRRIQS
jgi:hypothetical protein